MLTAATVPVSYANRCRCIYTRYADDITFSTSKSKFPTQLAWFAEDPKKFILGNELREIIQQNGFDVNESKVRLRTQSQHQEVTGITVNEKSNIKRKYVRQIRAMLHAWEKYGLEKAENEFFSRFDNKKRLRHPQTFPLIVRGKIEFLGDVRGKQDHLYLKFLSQLSQLSPGLVNAEKLAEANSLQTSQSSPLLDADIWTEGKTDEMHLNAALKGLQNKGCFKDLQLKFKQPVTQDTGGDTNLLAKCKHLRDSFQTRPTIMIFDHDNAKILSDAHDESKGFKDWGNNVYSFAIPIPNHRENLREICIEHYYKDDEIKRKNKDGRRLFLGVEFDYKNSLRHLKNGNLSINKKLDPMKIIDGSIGVFDENRDNVALSKINFASNILNEEEGFNDFDFQEFSQIFKVIEKILLYKTGNIN